LLTSISEAKMKPQRRLSYQPRDRGDHSKRCTLIGLGSMPRGKGVSATARRAAVVESELEPEGVVGILGESSDIRVRMVCKGSSGSQLSIWEIVSM
jgi:hypothetical protein